MLRFARPVLEEFEPRILYSADLAAVVAGLAQGIGSVDDRLLVQDLRLQQTSQDAAATRQEIAFVDLTIADANTLISGLQAQRDAGRSIEIVTIAAGADGLALIGATLAQRDGISAVHLVSHGDGGVVQLGATRLDMTTLLARAGEVAAWSGSLGADADLLIYGCDVAAGDQGRELLVALAALSGADVAASDDPTGAAARGGDWVLEQQTGAIESALAADAAVQQSWAGLLGNDIAVNTTTAHGQQTDSVNRGSQHAVAYDAAGNFVVVWTSRNQDADGYGVFARRFSFDGSPLTGEIQVNSTEARDQRHASVVVDSAGNFVVVWSSDQQDGNNAGVYLRRFAADGSALTGEIRANVSTPGAQSNPVIAMNRSDASFAVAWQGQAPSDGVGIYFRRFAADGSALDSSDQRGNLSDSGIEQNPALAMDSSGRLVLGFEVNNHVYFQRFDAAGTAQGARVQVDSGFSNTSGPAVAIDAAGNFTFVYRVETGFEGIWGRSYSADGTPQTLWFNVAIGDADSPSIGMADDGSFIVTYQKSGSGTDIFACEFDANGSAAAPAFAVNQYTAGDQTSASVALLDMDHYVVAWSGERSADSVGVSARGFAAANVAPVIVSHGGGATGMLTLDEGGGRTLVVSATDANLPAQALSYSITGGADAARFAINTSSGELRFVAAPDYEAADDAGANHVYDLVVQVSDGLLVDTQTLAVSINNVDEPPAAGGGTVNGMQDEARVLAWSDFGVSDIDSSLGANTALRFETLPADGRLQVFNGSAWSDLVPMQIVNKAQIDAVGLRFVPDAGESGNNSFATPGVGNGRQDYAQFSFRPLQTTPISIVNPGAQSNVLGEGTTANTAIGWLRAGTTGGAANLGAGAFALDHDNSLYVNSGAVLSQTLASSFVTGFDLNLGFEAGWRGDSGYGTRPGFSVELWAGSTRLGGIDETGVAGVRGAFVSGVLAVDGAAFASASGQALLIKLSGSNSQAHFDNLVLTSYTPANSLGSAATLTIDIASAQTAPVIQSNGGGAASSVLVAENTTAVATVSASDADLPAQTLSYSIVASGDGALFVVDAAGGGLRFITAPDREAAMDSDGDSVYVVTVRASDGTLADTQTLTVTVLDVNETGVGAITDTDASANAVAEIAGVGTLVGLDLQAIDADASNNNVSYALSDDQGGRFVIDANSGVVCVAAALDFETQATHIIVVTATSSDGSSRSAPFTINVLDANEAGVGALADADVAANSLAENASLGSLAGITALATDPDLADNISYSLVDDAGGRFVIAAGSGVVTLGAALDAEAASSHVIIVRADSSDGSFNSQAFTIVVQDVNESALSVLTDVDAAADQIDEGAAAGSRVGVTARAVDADRSNNAVTYALDNSAGGRFVIDSGSGVVSLARGIQEEGLAAHLISVRATSADASFSTRDFNITIDLVNDHAPVISSDGGAATATLGVDEGSTAVTQIVASDADLPAPALVYSISGGADAALFAIDAGSGGLRFITAPDAEAAADAGADNSYQVNLLASDGVRSDAQLLTVHVRDINEFAVGGIDDSDAAANVISENASPGARTGLTASARDADYSNSSLAYTLDNNAGGRFAIDANSGVVRLARSIAEEGFVSHTITVLASSADGSSSTQDMVIAVTLANDHAPAIVSEGGGDVATLSVDEGQLQVTVISAGDADLPAPTLVYSISGGVDAALFAIDAGSGALRFITAPDAEAAADAGADNIYRVDVLVSDGGRIDTQALTVHVRDINEFAVGGINDSDTAVDLISENASPGAGTGLTASARDADYSNSSLAYTLDNNAGGRFVIDASSGVVSLARGIQEEGRAAHLISVRATSTDASFSTRDFNITIGFVNDHAPVISSDGGAATATLAIDEGSTAVTRIVASDADLPAPSLTYAITDAITGGADAALFTIDAASGGLRFVLPPDYEQPADADRDGVYAVSVTASDGLRSDSQTLAIQLRNIDEAPVWLEHTLTVSEGGSAVPSLRVVDADSGPAQLRIQVQDLAGGQFESRAAPGVAITNFTLADLDAGQINFFSDGGEAAPRFLLLLADATSSLPAQAITVNFTPVNDVPVVAPISLGSIAEDGSLVVDLARLVSGASDAEGDVLLPAGLRVPSGGAAVTDLGGGRWRLDATPDWSGSLTLVYDVSDGVAATTAQAALDVLAVNDAPRFTNQGGAATVVLTVDENRAGVALLAATDIESPAALRFAIEGGADAALFTIDALTGALVFVDMPDHEKTRDADANGRYELIVRVSDGALTAQQAWQVTVANVDEAPVIARHALLLSDQGVTLVLQAADPDTGTAALVYEVGSSRGGVFELRDRPGQALTVFSQADVDAGRVVFVADASVATPSYSLMLSDGVNRVDAGAPQLVGSVAPAPTLVVAAASESLPVTPGAKTSVSADKASVDLPLAEANDAPATIAIDAASAAAEATLPAYDALPRPAASVSAVTAGPAQATTGLRGAAGDGTALWGAAQITLALPGDDATPVAQRIALDPFGNGGSSTLAQALDEVRRQMNDESPPVQMNVATTALVSGGLSVGYVLWLARGGVLVASLMSSVPAWASVDPLPVLAQMRRAEGGAGDDASDNEADETDPLERLFSRARRLLVRPPISEPSA